MRKTKVDLILHSGTILTMNENSDIVDNGAIAILNGNIIALGGVAEIKEKYSVGKSIDAKGGVIMPGLINTHTHAAMDILRGVADDLPLDKWLSENIFPLEGKFVDRNFAYWGSMLACAEMVLSGTTTFCDMYFFEKETGRAAEEIGMRGVIGEGIVTLGSDENEVWERKKALTLEMMKKFKNSKLISVAVEPHSPYTCSENILKAAKRFAEENHLLYCIHLAETKKEYSDFMQSKNMTPVEYLDSIGVLDQNTLAAHCVWIGKNDFKIMKERKVKVAHCPQSNMKLGAGIAPADKFIKGGITVSLGTDGAASNNTLDMFREMKSAALLAKVAGLDPTALSARETLQMATIEGARALGKKSEIGSLEIGKCADMVIVDFNQPHLTPVYDYYSHLVYSANGNDVKTVVINGEVILENREFADIDIHEITKKAASIAKRIKSAKYSA